MYLTGVLWIELSCTANTLPTELSLQQHLRLLFGELLGFLPPPMIRPCSICILIHSVNILQIGMYKRWGYWSSVSYQVYTSTSLGSTYILSSATLSLCIHHQDSFETWHRHLPFASSSSCPGRLSSCWPPRLSHQAQSSGHNGSSQPWGSTIIKLSSTGHSPSHSWAYRTVQQAFLEIQGPYSFGQVI